MTDFSNSFAERIETTETKAKEARAALNDALSWTTDWDKDDHELKLIQPVHREWQTRIRQIRMHPVSLTELDRHVKRLSKYHFPMWRDPIVLNFRLGNARRRVQINALRVWAVTLTVGLWVIDHIVLIVATVAILGLLAWIVTNWDSIVGMFNTILDSLS
jgi:hypothetical protein